ncbi:MAG: DUF1573 domain-containing protein [Polyangia bacterium]
MAAPRLQLAPPPYEMGPVVQDESVRRVFTVSNAGTLPLEISAIDGSRFCSASLQPMTIAPGASGQLEVTCRSDLYGPMRESILIHSNDPQADRVPIQLVANVTPLLAFDTQVINLQMPFGEQRWQELRLVGTLLDQATIKLKKSGWAEDSSVDFPPRQPGSPAILYVRCHGQEAGMHAGNITVTTGLVRPKEIAIPYACKVAGTLEVSPTNPYFNLKLPGPKLVSIEVRSSQPGFEVHGARVLEGPFAASLEGPVGDNVFRVQVRVLEERVADDSRASQGKLLILSNDRTEPKKEIPLFGFGKLNAAKGESPAP